MIAKCLGCGHAQTHHLVGQGLCLVSSCRLCLIYRTNVYVTEQHGKYEVDGFPRRVGPTTGHLSECLLISLAETAELFDKQWPPESQEPGIYCTCDDWSPE